MRISIILLLLCTGIDMVHSQARRIQIEMSHATYEIGLNTKEIDIISNRLTKLLGKYIEYGNFQNDEGIYSNTQNSKYLNLFTSGAKVYSDLHKNYTITSPSEYVNTIKEHFNDYGFDTVLEFAGLINITKIIENNYSAKLSLQKINYAILNETNIREFFKTGIPINLNMDILIDFTNNSYKISKIESIDNSIIDNIVLLSTIPINEVTANEKASTMMLKIPAFDFNETSIPTSDKDVVYEDNSITYEEHSTSQEIESKISTEISHEINKLKSSSDNVGFTKIVSPNSNYPMKTGISISAGIGKASFVELEDYTSSIDIPYNIQIGYLKSINKVNNLYLSFGINYDKQILNTKVKPNSSTPSSYLAYTPIKYLRTDTDDIMLQVSEDNIVGTSNDIEMQERMEYNLISLPIGIAYNVNITKKSSIMFASHIAPERLIYKNGYASTNNGDGNKFPVNEYFPSLDIIQKIDSDILNIPEYQQVSIGSKEERYDINKVGLGFQMQVSYNQVISKRLSLFISASYNSKIINESKNIQGADQLVSYHSMTDKIHSKHKKLNLGLLIKY